MRILILGVAGMLGHKLFQVCRAQHDTWGTVRGDARQLQRYGIFEGGQLISHVDALDFSSVEKTLEAVRPDAVINAIGIIKQLQAAHDPVLSISVNSLFPHRLNLACQPRGIRLIHISTDCVFSGRQGRYSEEDIPDPLDLYGRSKLLGEVDSGGALTLRTSIIGRELGTQSGLVEWFLSNRGGSVKGYVNAIYSGATTLALAQLIERILEDQRALTGLWHVASEPIDKHRLLLLIKSQMNLNIEVEPYDAVRIDRSLDGSKFERATGLRLPSWEEMVEALAQDPTLYDEWRTE